MIEDLIESDTMYSGRVHNRFIRVGSRNRNNPNNHWNNKGFRVILSMFSQLEMSGGDCETSGPK